MSADIVICVCRDYDLISLFKLLYEMNMDVRAAVIDGPNIFCAMLIAIMVNVQNLLFPHLTGLQLCFPRNKRLDNWALWMTIM